MAKSAGLLSRARCPCCLVWGYGDEGRQDSMCGDECAAGNGVQVDMPAYGRDGTVRDEIVLGPAERREQDTQIQSYPLV